MRKDWLYQRGDIYLADLSPTLGSEQGGIRPVVVIQNNIGNCYAPTLIVAPISTKVQKKQKQPTHCVMRPSSMIRSQSVVLLEQIRTIDKQRIRCYLGKVTQDEILSINQAMRISLALDG